MDDIKHIEESILLSFYDAELDVRDETFAFVRDLEKGNYLEVLNSSFCENVFVDTLRASSQDEPLDEILEKSAQQFIDHNSNDLSQLLHLLCVGVSALSAWQQECFTGPPLPESAPIRWLSDARGTNLDGEARTVLERPTLGDALGIDLKHPELLVVARAVLRPCAHTHALQSGAWWWARTLFAQQRALGEPAPTLHEALEALLSAGLPPISKIPWRALLLLEIVTVRLWFGQLGLARRALISAEEAVGIKCHLVGALGRRTRFQVKDVAQLQLQVELRDGREGSEGQPVLDAAGNLPKDLQLQDEERLPQVAYSEAQPDIPALTPVQQAVVLNTFALLQRAQPHDELASEQLMTYLLCVLRHPQWWAVQATALVLRSRLEAKEHRSAERAMTQLQEVSSAWEREGNASQRLAGVWAVGVMSHGRIQALLAEQLARLGCVQSALDLFLALRCWEEAVACYTALGLKHKAAELLRHEVEEKPSVALLCLLGDATDDTEQYERAWALSGQRSARAQRHWALYHFARKEYAESMTHLRLSLECNSLQPELWRRLGYAALDARDWDTCAHAYRRCCELDPECLEAWNNAAKAYAHLGDKERAWRALQEALRIDFENWRLWDNVMTVSADVGAFDEVVRAAHRMLDLQRPPSQHGMVGRPAASTVSDTAALRVLVRAIEGDLQDRDGRRARTHLRPRALELFGRLTGVVPSDPELWRLYAQLTAVPPTEAEEDGARAVRREAVAQRLLRSHRAAMQRQGWASRQDEAIAILATVAFLVDAHIDAADAQIEAKKRATLSSARFALKGALAAVKRGDLEAELATSIQALEEKLAALDETLAALRNQ